MPQWTLTNIMSRATAALGNRSDIALSVCSFMANQGEDIIWNACEHDGKEAIAVSSTTSGENRITLPSDFLALRNVSNLSASGLDLMEVWNRDDIDSSGTGLGTPTKFVREQDFLELWPSPDSSYSIQIRYDKLRSDMVAATATPSVATRYHYAVYLKTVELLADEVNDLERSAVYQNKYINYMHSTPSDLALRQQTREGMAMKFRWRGKSR